MSFRLPPDISSEKVSIAEGTAYVFRHTQLGQIGRVIIQTRFDGKTIASLEASGSINDPMTAKRKAMFEPLGRQLLNAMEQVFISMGRAPSQPIPPVLSVVNPTQHHVPMKIFTCDKCNANVALLFFADDNTVGGLEDTARLIFDRLIEFDVPTWIVGEISPLGDPMKNKAKIRKIYPTREEVFEASPEEFNPVLDRLEQEVCPHCKS